MNIDLAIKIITGLLALLLGVVGWELRTTIEDQRALQRQVDLLEANILPRVEQTEKELVNLWIMKNKELDEKLSDTRQQGMFYVDLMGKVIVVESNQQWIMKKIDR